MKKITSVALSEETYELAAKLKAKGVNISFHVEKFIIQLAKKNNIK